MSARDDLEEYAQAHGFADAAELIRLTNDLDYSLPGMLFAHETWKQHGGSKAALVKLIEASKKPR